MEYVIALMVAALGGLFFINSKKNKLAGELEQQKSVNLINKDQIEITKNETLLKTEEEKRQDQAKELTNEKSKEVSTDNLVDFFNDRK